MLHQSSSGGGSVSKLTSEVVDSSQFFRRTGQRPPSVSNPVSLRIQQLASSSEQGWEQERISKIEGSLLHSLISEVSSFTLAARCCSGVSCQLQPVLKGKGLCKDMNTRGWGSLKTIAEAANHKYGNVLLARQILIPKGFKFSLQDKQGGLWPSFHNVYIHENIRLWTL